MINSCRRDVSIYLKDNSLLISALKSTVTLFTPDKHQFQMHPDIILEDTQLPQECSPKILGGIMDPSLSFHRHCNYVSDRIDKINNMLKALSGPSWWQEKETLLLTYNALGKSIASYASPVWSTNASEDGDRGTQDGQYRPCPPGFYHAESQWPLRFFCAVPCELSGGGPRQSWHHNSRAKTKTHEGDPPLQTSLNCSSWACLKKDGKPPESAHACGGFRYSTPSKQPNTEEASTPNIGRGAGTQPKTTMHSLTTTVRTLPYIAGLQA